jgi:hypothetical protein
MFILSALSENTRASINGASCYNLTPHMAWLLSSVQIPKVLSAVESPWHRISDIKTISGDSHVDAASQKLATELLDPSPYLSNQSVVDSLDQEGGMEPRVASQILAKALSDVVDGSSVHNHDIVSEIGDEPDEVKVASQGLMHDLSSTISSNFHTSALATVMGPSHISAASQSLVSALSSEISSSRYDKHEMEDVFVPTSSVRSDFGGVDELGERQVASQKLMAEILDSIQLAFVGDEPCAGYLSPNGVIDPKSIVNNEISSHYESDFRSTAPLLIFETNAEEDETVGSN